MKLKELKDIFQRDESVVIHRFKKNEELGNKEFGGFFGYVPKNLLEKEVKTITTAIEICSVNDDSIATGGGTFEFYILITVLDE